MGDVVLRRVAMAHGALIVVLLAGLSALGLPTGGAALGGAAIGLAFLALWGIARTLAAEGRRGALAALGALKVGGYLLLAAGILTRRIVVDGPGFAGGVTCFLLAAVAVAFTRPAARQTA
jgi:hypothetical protein